MRHFQFYLLGCVASYACIHAVEIWDALKQVGIKKDVEPWTGIDRRQFARQLDGDERLVYNTLGKFPVTFWQEFAWRLVLKVGLPDRVRQSLPLLLAVESQKPMVKMTLADSREEQAS